jgi:signal transduction histidine kinase
MERQGLLPQPSEDATVHGRVLVVDDNRLNRQKLTVLLEQQGHVAESVPDGAEALARLHEDGIDLVLLDVLMPGIDGYEVLRRMKADHELRDIPVIVISALDEVESAVRCIENGAEDYLPKSFDPVLLRARIQSSLQRKRLRDLERAFLQQELALRQNEKLATLGRLSAGMAHELNNPSAAVLHGATMLGNAIPALSEAHLAVIRIAPAEAQLDCLRDLMSSLEPSGARTNDMDALTRSDRELEVESWLEERGVDEPWSIAAALVDLGMTEEHLTDLARAFPEHRLQPVLRWLTSVATLESLASQIANGAQRMADIVRALKSYSYMDQAPILQIDLHEGLDNTLIVLSSKLRQGIVVERDFAARLPRVEAWGGELNQVWTNLIDNAIDAMGGKGTLTLRTRLDGPFVVVEIGDTGPGIPEDRVGHIFDPFYTTKEPGKGTGLGLNIVHNIVVQKHGGRIDVDSGPAGTTFFVRIPLRQKARSESHSAGKPGASPKE